MAFLEILILGITVALALFIWLIAYGVRATKAARERRRELLYGALAPRDPMIAVSAETGQAALTVRGIEVRFSFTTRGSGSSAESWTEVEVDVPHEPLVLAARRQTEREEGFVREGLAVDVEVGDAEIDAAYLIEGAPAAVVRRLFTEAVRAKLPAVDPDEIETKPFGLLVAKRGWKEDQASIQGFVDLAVELAESVQPAISDAARVEAPQPVSAYRGEQASPEEKQRWQEARREVAERHAAEVAGVVATRNRRHAELTGRLALAVVAGIAGLVLLACVAYMLG